LTDIIIRGKVDLSNQPNVERGMNMRQINIYAIAPNEKQMKLVSETTENLAVEIMNKLYSEGYKSIGCVYADM